MKLSVIIPSYKGAEILKNTLPGLISYLKQKDYSFEIVVVDDGSNDGGATEQVVKSLGCVFIQNEINLGKGAAVRNGMWNAKGDFRIFTDADIPFEYNAFDHFVHYLDFKEFDVVVGDRTLTDSNYYGKISPVRKAGSNLFSFIVGRFVAGGYFDTQCGMKGFRKEAANDLFSITRINGFAFDVELLHISLKRNYDIKRLPVILKSQESSTVSLIRHAIGMIFDLYKIKWYQFKGAYQKVNVQDRV